LKFQAHVSDDFMIDGVEVYLSVTYRDGDSDYAAVPGPARRIMRFASDGTISWQDHEPMTRADPSMRLPEGMGQALLEALQRHYGGTGEVQATQAILRREQDRVDKLTDALISSQAELVARLPAEGD
jgi:hypothetical protein